MESSADSSGVGPRIGGSALEQEPSSTLVHSNAKELENTEWTDEKHSLFLKSMEATFVNQLYKSLDLSGWSSKKKGSSGSKSLKHKKTSVCAPGQFKVYRDGHWSEIEVSRDEAEANQDEKPGVLSTNQWIRHYRRLGRQRTRKSPVSPDKTPSPTAMHQYPAHNFQLWRQDWLDSNTEVTGQNFNDEDLEEEKSGGKHEIKRSKTSSNVVSRSDQVVPFCHTVRLDAFAEDCEQSSRLRMLN